MENAQHHVDSWVVAETLLPGTVVRYDCDKGFTMVPGNFEGKICEEDRTFESVPPNVDGACVRGMEILRLFE